MTLINTEEISQNYFKSEYVLDLTSGVKSTEALSDILVHDHRSDIYPVHVRTYVRSTITLARAYISSDRDRDARK